MCLYFGKKETCMRFRHYNRERLGELKWKECTGVGAIKGWYETFIIVGTRLQNNIGYTEILWVAWLGAMLLIKTGLRDSYKKASNKSESDGTIFIIYSYCKYNKFYDRQILWSLNHYFLSYCNFWIFRGLFQTKIFTCRSDFFRHSHFAGYFFWWNGDHGLKCGHYIPTIFIIYNCNNNRRLFVLYSYL